MIYLPNAASPPSPNAETRSSGKRGAALAKTGHLESLSAERQNNAFPSRRELWVSVKSKNRFSSILRGRFSAKGLSDFSLTNEC
jgi:hypothetical protein